MAGKPRGKGDNWDSRPNPFAGIRIVGHAPELASVPALGLALDKVLTAGCAVIIGRTRDGGALVFTVLDGETRHRTYCSTDAELEEAVKSLSFVYEE